MTSPRQYRSPAREGATARSRVKIIAAATRLLRSKEGAQRCTLEAVAKAAGVTRLTVYNLFGSRSALFEAVFDDRAQRGGLDQIANAMRTDDPRGAIMQLIATFTNFWASDRYTLGNLYKLGSSDAEFAAALAARNDRRHHAFNVLSSRLGAGGIIDHASVPELADILFALTSYAFYADLTARGQPIEKALATIAAAAIDAIARAESLVERDERIP